MNQKEFQQRFDAAHARALDQNFIKGVSKQLFFLDQSLDQERDVWVCHSFLLSRIPFGILAFQ